MRRSTTATRRLGLLTGLVTIALCVGAGCGDSGRDSTPAQPPATSAGEDAREETTPTTGTTDGDGTDRRGEADGRGSPTADTKAKSQESTITETVEGMYRDLAGSDAAGVCSVMTEAARAQIAAQVPGGSADAPAARSCEKSLSSFLNAAAQSGVLERTLGATVRDVQIDGLVATVTVAFGGSAGKIKLRREGGEWRFGVGAIGSS